MSCQCAVWRWLFVCFNSGNSRHTYCTLFTGGSTSRICDMLSLTDWSPTRVHGPYSAIGVTPGWWSPDNNTEFVTYTVIAICYFRLYCHACGNVAIRSEQRQSYVRAYLTHGPNKAYSMYKVDTAYDTAATYEMQATVVIKQQASHRYLVRGSQQQILYWLWKLRAQCEHKTYAPITGDRVIEVWRQPYLRFSMCQQAMPTVENACEVRPRS